MGKTRKRKKNKFFFIIWVLVIVGISIFLFLLNLKFSYFTWFNSSRYVSPIPPANSLSKKGTDKYDNDTKALRELLGKNRIDFSEVSTSSGSSFLIRLSRGEEILFSSKKPYQAQISSLQLILSRLTIEGKQFSRLDLRFDAPVIELK